MLAGAGWAGFSGGRGRGVNAGSLAVFSGVVASFSRKNAVKNVAKFATRNAAVGCVRTFFKSHGRALDFGLLAR